MSGVQRLGSLIELLGSRGLLRSVVPAAGRGAEAAEAAQVGGVTLDSRRVQPGWLFAALRGRHADGLDFAQAAVSAGASAILAEQAAAHLPVPQVLVSEGRAALALAAAWHARFPSRDLGVVGITGTDGKTTTAYLVRAILEAAGRPTGLLGTIDVICGGRSLGNPGRSTTPEAPELQAHLACMRDAGDRWAVIESTSHGLAQDRVTEVAYDVGVLTNIGHEHLEFHGTLEAYRAAKLRLFERLEVGVANPEKGHGKSAVVNGDDAFAGEFAAAAGAAGARVLSYSIELARGADLLAHEVREGPGGLGFRAVTPRWQGLVQLRLAGRFNVHNALAALGVAEALALDPGLAAEALAAVEAVPGRMQRIVMGQPFTVIVDYAHTPESLAKVLDELAVPAAAAGGGLIAVFGSAGERDTQKRPRMGKVAAERCRLVVLTDEDPRSERPEAILEAIAAGAEAAGLQRGRDLLLVPDRAAAIREALGRARPGDVVLLAGKGHERTIETRDGALSWDEAAVVRAALAELGYGAAAS